MKNVKLLILAVLTISFASCEERWWHHHCHEGNGSLTTETRDVSGFSEISLAISADVNLTQANDYLVTVEASSNVQEYIITEVTGGTLQIKTKRGECIDDHAIINISMPDIEAVEILGSGNIAAAGLIQADEIELTISGSGDIRMADLEAEEVHSRIMGSGDIDLTGTQTVRYHRVKISGSGDVNALALASQEADVDIAGSGDCNLQVLDKLDVKIVGSGDVRYIGSPDISSEVLGSGNIKPY